MYKRQLYVYLLLEFQSDVDPWMAVRLLVYVGLLYQDLIRAGCLTPDGCLPPVLGQRRPRLRLSLIHI